MHISYQKEIVNTLDEKILITLFTLLEKYQKSYCFPSQQKLLNLLSTYHGISCCRRTLNYHLKHLELLGYIVRKRRLKRLHDGTLSLSTSLYFLTKEAYAHLKTMCRFAVSVLKKRPTWIKQFHLKDKIKSIKGIPDPKVRRTKYLNAINQVLS